MFIMKEGFLNKDFKQGEFIMNKKTKSVILLATASLLSLLIVACGKVHNEISQIRVTSISVGNTNKFYDGGDKIVTNQIDTEQVICCKSDDPTDCEYEDFYDGKVMFKIKNNLNYVIQLTHFYYVVKNYYGGGNDYISPNLAFVGDNIIDGSDASTGQNQEIISYGAFTDASNGKQRFASSNETIDDIGTKNVIFYLTAITERGETLTFSRAVPVVFGPVDQCDND